MDQFDLVIFDFDGTLCNMHSAIRFCIRKTFEHLALPLPEEKAITDTLLAGVGLAETFKSLCPIEPTDELTSQSITIYRRIYNSGAGLERSTLFNGTSQTLAALHANDIPIVITSNKGEAAIIDMLNLHQLRQYVGLVVGDNGTTRMKPHPESFVTRIRPRHPQASLDRIIMVGDTEADIRYAKNAGILSCWASYGYGDADACTAAQPDYTIGKLADTLTLKEP